MELTTVREIFKNREAYLDKEIQVGGWVAQQPRFKNLWIYCTA